MDGNQKRFIEDTLELLNELDEGLMQLEANPLATAPLEQVFRTMHTIKGAASMFGFDNISQLAHHIETLFDHVRKGNLQITDRLISLTLHAFDKVRYLLGKNDVERIINSAKLDENLQQATAFLQEIEQASVNSLEVKRVEKRPITTYVIRITPSIILMADGNHPLPYLVKDLETLGTTTAWLHQEDNTLVYWTVILFTASTPLEIESYFIFVEHECTIKLIHLANENLQDDTALHTIVVRFHEKEIGEEELRAWAQKRKLSQVPVSTASQADAIDKKFTHDSVIRVSKRKIDDLMNWISELVILQAQVLNVAKNSRIAELDELTERLEMVTGHLRDTSLEIGLVPIETLVTKFKRLVRDLSKSLGKKVNFISVGTETEMDKDVIEMMTDPIMHLIRNAIDHGIESPETRNFLGKSEHGTIKLKAYQSAASINLVVSDDGRGIDKNRVFRKAVAQGIVEETAVLSQEEIYNLILHPSLSTSDIVSDISGRGVGMDVVNQRIMELRGCITISSTPGEGTSFHIKLPLSRSIIEGLLMKVANTHYVMPLNTIESIDRIPYASLDREGHVNTDILVNNELLNVYSLRKNFYAHELPPKTTDIISVYVNGNRRGIAVDSIQGKIQAVLKPLGEYYEHPDFISASTILGDGTMALVLDPQRLFSYQTL
ncbi:MAG TPA: chemotaxis protein CheA [Ohtaekwangia sp.]|uniref:chemotaxis protein CheA n=1 Tax=Ohtaekwangia sp. TaxID=2066019 RepID=UPI002F943F66